MRVKKESNLTINFANLLQKPTVTITLKTLYLIEVIEVFNVDQLFGLYFNDCILTIL